jgi:uncharacterized iron-regulated protein
MLARIGAAALLLGSGFSALAEEFDASRFDTLPPADVYLLGETHDNRFQHENQALAVAVLNPGALVFEMFGPAEALAATPEARANADRLSDALGWADSGWPDFRMYYPIFVAAPDATVFGGALPRDVVRRAVSDGAAEVFGSGAELFGLDNALDADEQAQREAGQMAAHCDALPEHVLPGMVEAQRLRDAALTRAVVAALAETGGPVVVIAGNGHVRTDWGMPAMLATALPDATVLSIGQLEAGTDVDPPYDLWIVTPVAERDDPCAAFR